MIDTIKLELTQSMFTVINHHLFNPPTSDMFKSTAWERGKVTSSKQNPTKQDKKAGIYKPRLTITRRPLKHLGYSNTLYVEVSLPKLVFGNNFDELTNNDFEVVKTSLIEVLKTMGVLVQPSQLDQAKISSIHYGKNIILTDYTTPFSFINELKKVDISKIYDINQTDYRNGGLSYKVHSNLFEMAFYDKIKELEQSKVSQKRSISKDDYCQLSLLDHIESMEHKNNPFQVLRVEMRLNKRRKIRQILKKYGLIDSVCFPDLYNQDLAQYLLTSYYQELVKNYIPTNESSDETEMYFQLKANNPKYKESKLLELTSTQIMINKLSVRGFRNMISNKTWYRLKRSLIKNGSILTSNPLVRLKRELERFEPVKLVDFPQLMLNNDKNEIN